MDEKTKDKAEDKGSIVNADGSITVKIRKPWSDYLIAICNQLGISHDHIDIIPERFTAVCLAEAYILGQAYPDDPMKQITPALATVNGKLWPTDTLDLYNQVRDSFQKNVQADQSAIEDELIRNLKCDGIVS